MSLLEHYIKSPGFSETDGSFHRFDTQYQSNATLFDWPNRVLYQGKVVTHPSVADLRLTDLLQTPEKSSSQLSKLFEKSLVFIDVDLVGEKFFSLISESLGEKEF
jgi:hypothetical protein